MGERDARPTTTSPGAERPDDLRPSRRALATARRVRDEPTLAEANAEHRTLVAAELVMSRLGCPTLSGAIEKARARVRGARERQGYDHKD